MFLFFILFFLKTRKLEKFLFFFLTKFLNGLYLIEFIFRTKNKCNNHFIHPLIFLFFKNYLKKILYL